MPLPNFTPAQDSLFLTLGSRALDSRLPRPFLGDTTAGPIVTELGYRLDKFPTLSAKGVDPRSKVFDVAVRTKRLDEMVRRFIAHHPDAVVLDLGAGLDGRAVRVAPPATIEWYDVDFPEVIAVREQVLPSATNVHTIAADLTDPGWLAEVPADRPTVLVADGLVPFLRQRDLVDVLRRLVDHCGSGELLLNGYSTYALWLFRHSSVMAPIVGAMVNPGFNHPRVLESWVPGLTLVEEVFLTRSPEVDELPPFERLTSRVAARSARLSRVMRTMVLRYSF